MKLAAALLTATVAFFGLTARAQSDSPRKPIARIGDQSVYDEDLFPLIGGQMWQLKLQEYELKSKALNNLIGQRLLDAEARARGISSESLLEETVYLAIPAPTASDLETYYLTQKHRINQPLSEVRSQMEQGLRLARRLKARQDYMDRLRQKPGVTVLLVRPRVAVEPDPARLRGNPDAPVTIIEFSDFQCPHCQTVQSPLKAVMAKYEGKVRLGFRDYPLREIHPQAQSAAEASRCAGEQGRFWEYHDLLFLPAGKFDAESLRQHARTAGLDLPRFDKCVTNGTFREAIENDIQLGNISGVVATPAFYFNGQLLTGYQDVTVLTNIIELELAAATLKGSVR